MLVAPFLLTGMSAFCARYRLLGQAAKEQDQQEELLLALGQWCQVASRPQRKYCWLTQVSQLTYDPLLNMSRTTTKARATSCKLPSCAQPIHSLDEATRLFPEELTRSPVNSTLLKVSLLARRTNLYGSP